MAPHEFFLPCDQEANHYQKIWHFGQDRFWGSVLKYVVAKNIIADLVLALDAVP